MFTKTSRTLSLVALLSLAAWLGGCIVSDQLSTITIHPDGSADVVKVQSNVHSSATGAKAGEELQKYVSDFNAQKDEDHVRLIEAGGQVRESRWTRSEPPYANVIVGKLPTAAALEKSFNIKDDKGTDVVTARFIENGTRRKLSLQVTLPPDDGSKESNSTAEDTIEALRTSQANGLSETRFAVTGGKIVDARGFTVAGDKQSALLEPRAILELLKTQRQVELYLEWELAE